MSWLSAARTRLHLLFARRASESRMNEELAFHIDMETQRLVREQRLSSDEARRRAVATFGGVTQHAESLRDGRGLAWLGGMNLDMKLGFRMLVKYPGLTIIGGLAMAFSIWVGALVFEGVRTFISPSLPLPGGDRIVMIKNWDVAKNQSEKRALYDFGVWRGALRSVTDLGVYRDVARNLILTPEDTRLVQGAEMSAVGALIFYSLFVMSASPNLVATIPLVIFGLFRYWYVVDRHEGGESPTDVVLTDVPLLLTIGAWVGICVLALSR